MSAPVDVLLAQLEGVRKAGKGWSARCPAHQDRSASLAIGEGDNGGVLLHCFAGCTVHEITAAVGLTVSDLFPPREQSRSPEDRKRLRAQMKLVGWGAALPMLDFEARILLLVAHDVAAGVIPSDEDMARADLAAQRIAHARAELAPADYKRVMQELREAVPLGRVRDAQQQAVREGVPA